MFSESNKNHANFYLLSMEFGPQAGFANRLSKIAENLPKDYSFPQWSSNAQSFQLYTSDNLQFLSIDHRSATVRIRSDAAWTDFKENKFGIFRDILSGYEINEVKEASAVREVLLDLEMSYEEMAILGNQNLLRESSRIVEESNDWLVAIVRDDELRLLRIDATPMKHDTAIQQFKQSAAITQLHDPIWNSNLKNLIAKVDGDRLFVRFQVTNRKLTKHDVERKMTESVFESTSYIERLVRVLTNQE